MELIRSDANQPGKSAEPKTNALDIPIRTTTGSA
jgi:hypothetical protein